LKSFEVNHLIRKMAGSSQAVLIGASDGNCYIAKFFDAIKRPNALFNEAAGYEIYRSVGLPVPDWSCLSISSWMIDGNADCWGPSTDKKTKPRSGICFGSRFAACPPQHVYEILPSPMFACLRNQEDFWLSWVVDVLSRHCDHRQALFVEGVNGSLQTVFIDHSHLFGGPDGSEIPYHSIAQYLDPRIYFPPNSAMATRLLERLGRCNSDILWRKLACLPDEWKNPSALHSASDCLNRLSASHLARSTCEELFKSVETASSQEVVKCARSEQFDVAVTETAFTK